MNNDFLTDGTRLYSWELVFYDDICLSNIINLYAFDKKLRAYAFIMHDKDKKEDSDELKELHYHSLLVFKQNISFSTLKRLVAKNSTQNIRAIPLNKNQYNERYEYLFHKNNPEKFPYEENDIIQLPEYYFKSSSPSTDDDIDGIIDGIIDKVSLRELAHRYGRDFIKNYTKYIEFARLVAVEEGYLTKDGEYKEIIKEIN